LHLLFLAEAALSRAVRGMVSLRLPVALEQKYKASKKEEDMTTGPTVHYRFHHRHLIVTDVAKTAAFYEDTLGARKVQETEFRGIPIVRLELDGMPLTISQQIHAGVGDHIGLAVDDFEAAVTELRAKGAQFIVEPTDMGFAKFAFIQDAAGTTLEVLQVMKQS
jgi:catechol 2,3-dioxygenase-like lactoylglutathione lyase family enzyme